MNFQAKENEYEPNRCWYGLKIKPVAKGSKHTVIPCGVPASLYEVRRPEYPGGLKMDVWLCDNHASILRNVDKFVVDKIMTTVPK